MKVELKKYERKYFFKFILKILNSVILRNMGYFDFRVGRRFFKNILERKYFFMVLFDKKIVGMIFLFKDKEMKRWTIGYFIFRKYRNKGICRHAIKELLKIAKKMKIDKVFAEIYSDNLPSIVIVKKLGFKRVNSFAKKTSWEKKI